MIQSNELRRGNLVSTIYDPKIRFSVTKITEIAVDLTSSSKRITGISCHSLLPIPLTEELLLKFGFEKQDINNNPAFTFFRLKVLSHGTITFYRRTKGFHADLGTKGGYHFGTTKVQYVHELQNLYFALTNQELEMKQ